MDDLDFWRTPQDTWKAYVLSGGRQLHLRENAGHQTNGLPLICLHAAPLSGRSFARLLSSLSRDRYALAPDLPGYGLSDRPPNPPNIEDYADAILELLNLLDLREIAVFGKMMGAKVACDLARRHPERVKALILAGITLSPPQLSAPTFDTVPLAEDGAHIRVLWDELTRAKSGSRPPALIQRDVSELLLSYPDHDWGYAASARYALENVLPDIVQPVLVLNTEGPLRNKVRAAAQLVAHAEIVERDDWQAGYLDTKFELVADVVNAFLADKGQGRGRGALPPPRRSQDAVVRRAYVEGPYGQVHYRIAEPKNLVVPPLTCFHASPQSGIVFESLAMELGRDRLVLAPDTPGFGESEWPPAPLEIEDFARVMADVWQRLGIDESDVFGFHTGSMTAVELALTKPTVVRKVAMISAPIFSDDELATFRAHYQPIEIRADGQHMIEAWQSFFQWRGPGQTIENYARNNFTTWRAGPARHWGHRAAFNYPFAEKLARVNQPVLVLNPNDDLVEQSRRAAPIMKDGRIIEMPNLGHGMLDCATVEVAGQLRAFLDET